MLQNQGCNRDKIPPLDLRLVWGCLVCVFKQSFSVFKQHFTYFNVLFHPHVFSQIFFNNNFQFLNTSTKRILCYFILFFFSLLNTTFILFKQLESNNFILSMCMLLMPTFLTILVLTCAIRFFFFLV